jgi:predicted dienelactone hydrolase
MKYLLLAIFLPLTLFAFEPRPVTPYPVVGFKDISFFDKTYKMKRDLLIWYPVDPVIVGTPSQNPWDLFNVAINAPLVQSKTKPPIIVISHGYTGNPHSLSWLIRGLVRNGFIVLGIEHIDLINGKVHMNHWQRALDVSTVIDQFSSSPMAKSADLKKIAIAGFSLGGTTAIWIAGGRSTKLNSLIPSAEYAAPEDFAKADEALPTLNKEMMAKDLRDARVKAAFVMAPAWSWLFDETSLHKISIPVYLIAAAADKVLVTKNNAGFFARNIPNAIYQEIPGNANHYIFVSALNETQRKAVKPTADMQVLFENDVSVDRPWIQCEVVEEAVGFFNSVFQ